MGNPPISAAVGRRIAAARHRAGLTQAQLAARLDWPRDTLIHYEHARRPLSVDRLAQLAGALGVHPAALLIADEATALLVSRLASDDALRAQVAFFIQTLGEE